MSRRLAWVSVSLGFVLAAFVGCSDDSTRRAEFGGECHEGTFGCPCVGNNCLTGLICVEGICEDAEDTGTSDDGDGDPGDGEPGDGEPGDGEPGDGDGEPGDGDGEPGDGDGEPGDGDGDPELLGTLERCTANADCDGGVCKATVKNGVSRCTLACANDGQCPAGTRCIDDGQGQFCLGDDVGRACAQASSCNYGCLLLDPGYCTAECDDGSDCPNGYACSPVGQIDVCVKLEALCDGQDNGACITNAACDLGPNLILGSCTAACDSAADCPRRAAGLPAWTCDGACRRPADVYAPLEGGWTPVEYHCNAQAQTVALCNDAQHMNFASFTIPNPPAVDCNSNFTVSGVAGDSCVNSCRYEGGCAHGFACVAVGSVGNDRIGLCLPTGGGEPGTACTKSADCAFGYCVNGSCSRDCTHDGICPGDTSCVAGGGPAVEGAAFMRCE